MPNILLRNLVDFNLKPNELIVALCILSYRPGTPIAAYTIAKATNLSVHKVRDVFRHFEKMKYIHRFYHIGDKNTFSCNGLYRAVAAYAKSVHTPTHNLDTGIDKIAPYPMQILDTNKEDKTSKNIETPGYNLFIARGENIIRRSKKH